MKMVLAIYFIILFLAAISDLFSRHISIVQVLFLFVISIIRFILRINSDGISFVVGLVGCIPGLILILLSLIYPKDIGLGDGLVLIITELGSSVIECCISLLLSFTSVFVVTLLMKIVCHFRKEDLVTVPFIPFIAFGVVITEILI